MARKSLNFRTVTKTLKSRDHREDPIPWGNFHFSEAGPGMYVCMYVYYCRTYEKAVSRGGEGKGRTCAKGHH